MRIQTPLISDLVFALSLEFVLGGIGALFVYTMGHNGVGFFALLHFPVVLVTESLRLALGNVDFLKEIFGSEYTAAVTIQAFLIFVVKIGVRKVAKRAHGGPLS